MADTNEGVPPETAAVEEGQYVTGAVVPDLAKGQKVGDGTEVRGAQAASPPASKPPMTAPPPPKTKE